VSDRPYETVTDIPVLIPARYIPGKRQYRDTFRNHWRAIRTPRRVSDPQVPEAPRWIPPYESVVMLRFSDLSLKSVQSSFARVLGKQAANDVEAMIELQKVAKLRPKFAREAVKDIYRRLWKRATGEDFRPLDPNTIEFVRRKTGKTQLPDVVLNEFVAARDVDKAHAEFLAGLLNNTMEKARLVLWWNGKRFTPAIWCPDLKTAYQVLMIPALCGTPALCVCPRCQRIFLQSRADQRFHSERCQGAFRVEEWRRKQKQASISREGKSAGTHPRHQPKKRSKKG